MNAFLGSRWVRKPYRGAWGIRTESSLARGLAGYWLFNEGCGTRVTDLSGNGLHGDGAGHAPTWGAGKWGIAPRVDGTVNQYFEVPDSPRSRAGEIDFTVAFWVNFSNFNPRSDGSAPHPLGKRSPTISDYDFNTSSTGAGVTFTVTNNSVATVAANTSGITLLVNTWYFIVGWRTRATANNPNQLGLQVNNGTIFTQTLSAATLLTSTSPLQFGNIGSLGNRSMSGSIDFAGFWKRALTAGERSSLYRDPFTLVRPPATRRFFGPLISTGRIAASLAPVVLASSATAAAPASSTGTIASSLQPLTFTATASVAAPASSAGTFAAAIAPVIHKATGTVDAAPSATGTISVVLAGIGLEASGVFPPPADIIAAIKKRWLETPALTAITPQIWYGLAPSNAPYPFARLTQVSGKTTFNTGRGYWDTDIYRISVFHEDLDALAAYVPTIEAAFNFVKFTIAAGYTMVFRQTGHTFVREPGSSRNQKPLHQLIVTYLAQVGRTRSS